MIKVLHIVENFGGQAIEDWLTKLLIEDTKQDRSTDWTFFCCLPSAGRNARTITEYGGCIVVSPYTVSSLLPFLKNLRNVLKEGQYEVLHCHHDIMSGLYLLASIGLPIRKRIVHVHNTALTLPISGRIKELIARVICKWLCLVLADQIIGVSRDALKSFHNSGSEDNKFQVLHCGLDLSPFLVMERASGVREELGIPYPAKTLLFVGRMIPYKNPLFVLEILEKLVNSGLDSYAIFAGEGPMIEQVAKIADMKGLSRRARLLGRRDDIPALMRSSNILICPSMELPKEGLGLVIIEAQAAGLQVLMSKSIPDEAIVIPEVITVQPLSAGSDIWSGAVQDIFQSNLQDSKQHYLEKIQDSSFSISNSLLNLLKIYR